MSQLVLAIIAFVLFSVITDFLEGMKKKRNQQAPPTRPNTEVGADARQRDASREASAAKPAGQGALQTTGQSDVKRPVAAKPPTSYIAAKPKIQPSWTQPAESERDAKILKPTDIHSEALLNAVAYAQILQPPKAYQYMATKSCRGEWHNQK